MSEFNKRIEKPMKHLFEIGDLNVYDKNVINLSAGTPSPRLLLNCCEIFEKATIACMVRKLIQLYLYLEMILFVLNLM